MIDLNKLGLLAYFEHKVEEYGVYFFDPYYYEVTEPFHSNFRQVTNSFKGHRSKLIPNFFQNHHPDKFAFQQLNPYLVCISKEPVDVVIGMTGVVVKMVDNSCGLLQFPYAGGTAKAFFSAKTLFRDGWHYTGDPMRLPR